jgi:glycosyltransferase involved in cell wall biosynthesis
VPASNTYSVSDLSALEPSVALGRSRGQTSWLQVMSHLSPQFGGIATSVPRLARATEAASLHRCPIAGFCDSAELNDLVEDHRAGITIYTPSRARWMVNAGLRRSLKQTIQASTGVHIHGVWETHCMMAASLARESKRPYVISVHGMLEDWAIRFKRIKKALYAALVEIRRMQRAACLRALSLDEVDDYRRLGLTNPIAIIPNGTDIYPGATPGPFRDMHPELNGKRIVLFLGRLHQKKGLPLLLQAWESISRKADDVHLVIAGPDPEGMWPALEKLIEDRQLQASVTYVGMLAGEQKWSALAAASLFVLPSYSEGFSIAVLEALAMGVPVVVTTQCHIPEVAIQDCGWVIQPAVGPLEQAMDDFLSFSQEEAELIGKRGRDLVRTRFHTSVVGNQMAQLYDWLQGGDKPSSVEIV